MIFTFVGLLILSALLADISEKWHASEIIPTVMLSIVILLYPFYCVNHLHLGRMVITALFLLLAAYALWQILKRRSLDFKRMISPGLCTYIIACLLIGWISAGKHVGLWDELRLWGAVPKALWYTEQLQLGRPICILQKYSGASARRMTSQGNHGLIPVEN